MVSFRKAERLCVKKHIDLLFREGKSFGVYPFRVVWMIVPCEGRPPLQVLISIPKRLVRKAVNRNTIRRKIKEAYRLNKGMLADYLSGQGKCMRLAILYQGDGVPVFSEVERKIILILHRLILINEEDPR